VSINGPFDAKLAVLMKEWDHVQFHVGRLDTIAFNIRQWSITLVGVFLGAAATLKRPELMVLAMIPVVLFWLNDALFKSYQRRFIKRGMELEAYMSSGQLDLALDEGTWGRFTLPQMSIKFEQENFPSKILRIVNAALLPNVAASYLSALTFCAVAYLGLRFLG
jgi:hypothetical protein